MKMRKETLIYAVRHYDEYIALGKMVIDDCVKSGVKSIGVERELRDIRVVEIIKKFLQSGRVNPQFAKRLSILIRVAEIFPQEPMLGLFGQISKYAAEKGLKVHVLEGTAGSEAAVRLALEKINSVYGPSIEEFLSKEDIMHFIEKAIARVYPSSYVINNLRTNQMAEQIKNKKPEIVFLGRLHAPEVLRKLGLPKRNLVILQPGLIKNKGLKARYLKWRLMQEAKKERMKQEKKRQEPRRTKRQKRMV